MNVKNVNLKIVLEKSCHASVIKAGDQKSVEDNIRAWYALAIQTAMKKKIKSLTLGPLTLLGVEFPIIGVAKILAQEILRLLREKTVLKEIIVEVGDEKNLVLFKKQICGYIDHVLNDLGKGPYVTADVIIELKEGIILIERSNPPLGWALPGGFVDYGESLEEAVVREAKEETNMKLVNLRQLHTYSAPGRDPRFQTITTVFIARGIGRPQFGDDAKGLKIVPYVDLLKLDYAFDHKQVIRDYLKWKKDH